MVTTWAYFDTSALAKRYLKEAGSVVVKRALQRYRILSSSVTALEMLSALERRRTTGELADRDALAIRTRMQKDRAYWELVEVGPLVLAEAEAVIQKTGLRTLDALHVASALVVQQTSGLTLPFITADAKQREAAERLALTVMWVE